MEESDILFDHKANYSREYRIIILPDILPFSKVCESHMEYYFNVLGHGIVKINTNSLKKFAPSFIAFVLRV
jgi:hypothetical protein